MRQWQSLLCIAGIVLLASNARADVIFGHDGTTIGERRKVLSLDVTFGVDRVLNDWSAIAPRVRFDYGLTSKLQLSGWFALSYNPGNCSMQLWGEPVPGGCVSTNSFATGMSGRLGLWRSDTNRVHLGAELGVSLRPVIETRTTLGVFVNAGVIASVRYSRIGIAYGRLGGAVFHRGASSSPGTSPMVNVNIGTEVVFRRINLFLETNIGLLFAPRESTPRSNPSVVIGIAHAWGAADSAS